MIAQKSSGLPSEVSTDVVEDIVRTLRADRESKRRREDEEVARRVAADAATPRVLPFSQPPRNRSDAEHAASECTPQARSPHSTQSIRMIDVANHKVRTAISQSSHDVKDLRKTLDFAVSAGASSGLLEQARTQLAEAERALFRPISSGCIVDVCSEFSGIGGLEHGIRAGFQEHSLELRLLEASELPTTSAGRHATAVLRKRFPGCIVHDPDSRASTPYPASAIMVDATPVCTEHSGLNANGCPDQTETLLLPFFKRLSAATQVELVVLEEVPNFLSRLEGQSKSSYSFWVNGLQRAGFSEHAYVVMPTRVAGDLHHRSRLLSVHTKGCFHPSAALLRLLTGKPPQDDDEASGCSDVFCFTTGLSETRHSARSGVAPVWGRLPAYNSNLNVAIYFRGLFYSLSPWTASRCSGLPDEYQDVESKGRHLPEGAITRPTATDAAAALANMVSPLQARELGHAIGSEWQKPRAIADIPALDRAPEFSEHTGSSIPKCFPRSQSVASSQSATVCFNDPVTGTWRSVELHHWRTCAPVATLEHICTEAIERGEMPLLRSLVDLQRVVDDISLNDRYRQCASRQLARLKKEAKEWQRRRTEQLLQQEQHRQAQACQRAEADHRRAARAGAWCKEVTLHELQLDAPDIIDHLSAHPLRKQAPWVACDACGRWRRWQQGRPFPAGPWTCRDNDDPHFAACSVPQELSDDAIDCELGIADESYPSELESVTITLRGSALPSSPQPSSWAACDRCGKWRRLLLPLDEQQLCKAWYCELNPDRKRNKCDETEETWSGEDILEPVWGQASIGAGNMESTAHAIATSLYGPDAELRTPDTPVVTTLNAQQSHPLPLPWLQHMSPMQHQAPTQASTIRFALPCAPALELGSVSPHDLGAVAPVIPMLWSEPAPVVNTQTPGVFAPSLPQREWRPGQVLAPCPRAEVALAAWQSSRWSQATLPPPSSPIAVLSHEALISDLDTNTQSAASLQPPLLPVSTLQHHSSSATLIRPSLHQSTPALVVDKQVHRATDERRSITVSRVLKHHIYAGASAGSLHNVYARLAFSDGRTTGPYYVPIEKLLCSRVLADYMDTAGGDGIRQYIPKAHALPIVGLGREHTGAMVMPVETRAMAAKATPVQTAEAQQAAKAAAPADVAASDAMEPREVAAATTPKRSRSCPSSSTLLEPVWPSPCFLCGQSLVAPKAARSHEGWWVCDRRAECAERKRIADLQVAMLPRGLRSRGVAAVGVSDSASRL